MQLTRRIDDARSPICIRAARTDADGSRC
jgi:hypothetical protein